MGSFCRVLLCLGQPSQWVARRSGLRGGILMPVASFHSFPTFCCGGHFSDPQWPAKKRAPLCWKTLKGKPWEKQVDKKGSGQLGHEQTGRLGQAPCFSHSGAGSWNFNFRDSSPWYVKTIWFSTEKKNKNTWTRVAGG